MWKWLAFYYYFKENKAKKYFFCLDQRDCFLTDHPEKKIETFLEKDCSLLFNAECRCVYFPYSVRAIKEYSDINKYFANYGDVKRFESDTYLLSAATERNGEERTRYLNGGCFMGRTDYFVDFLNKYHRVFEEFINLDDQCLMHHYHFAYYPEIKIDNQCDIFERVRVL